MKRPRLKAIRDVVRAVDDEATVSTRGVGPDEFVVRVPYAAPNKVVNAVTTRWPGVELVWKDVEGGRWDWVSVLHFTVEEG